MDHYVFKFPGLKTDGTRQSNFAIRFHRKVVLIGGTGYTRNEKAFSLPEFHITCEQRIPMHCSANVGDKR
jgi:ATP-dependent phosphoenolpyruvate carboxykinase